MEDKKLAQRLSANLLNLGFLVTAWMLLIDVFKKDILQEQDEQLGR
jgi:hypothetical protein